MKTPLLRLATQVYDTPLAIIPEKLEVLLHVLQPRLDSSHQSAIDRLFSDHLLLNRTKGLSDGAMDLLAFDDDYDSPQQQQPKKPYQLTDAGVAIIPIKGTLLKKGDWMSAMSGCTSYAAITNAFTTAINDDSVRGILLDIDSPGGTTHGCFELADLIHSSRKTKPIVASANDLAASAAYALASAADSIYLTQTGAVGSIGVFMLHCDQEGMDKQIGLKYTYIFAGDKKVDGNPHESLSRLAKRDCQTETDRQYQLFVDCVSRNRSVSTTKIQDTEAGILSASAAIPLLADSIGTFDDALASLTKRISSTPTRTIGKAASAHATIPDSSQASLALGDNDMSVTLADLLAKASPEELAQLATLAASAKKEEPEGKSDPKDKKMKSAPKDDDDDEKDEPDDDDDDDEPDDKDDKDNKKKDKKADDMKKSKKSAAVASKKDDEEDCEPGAEKAAAASIVNLGATIESISDMCLIAKRPDLIAAYTKLAVKGQSLAAIRTKFQNKRAAESGADPIDATPPERTNLNSGVMGASTDALIQRARTIAANSSGRLTTPAAMSAVLRSDSSIYEAYLSERASAGNPRSSTARQFHEAQQARMKQLGLCADSTQLPRPQV